MAFALAFKRTAHFYKPSVQRWVSRSVPLVFFWLIGLSTGLYAGPVNHSYVTFSILAGIIVLWLLKLWAGDGQLHGALVNDPRTSG